MRSARSAPTLGSRADRLPARSRAPARSSGGRLRAWSWSGPDEQGSKLPAASRRAAAQRSPAARLSDVKHHGWREFLARLVTAPLRLVGARASGARAAVDLGAPPPGHELVPRRGRPVTIVMPDLRRPVHHHRRGQAAPAHRGRRAHPDRRRRRRKQSEHQARLRELEGAELELGDDQPGLRRRVNRGLARAGRDRRRRGAQQRRDRSPALARAPAVRRLRPGRHRRRRADAAVSRRAHPGRGRSPQPRRAAVVRPSLPLQAPRSRPGERARHRAGGHRRRDVPPP